MARKHTHTVAKAKKTPKPHAVKVGLVGRPRTHHTQIARGAHHVLRIHSHSSHAAAKNPWQTVII